MFKFPLESDPSTGLSEPKTPLQNKHLNGKENDSGVTLSQAAFMDPTAVEPRTPELFKKPLRVVQPTSSRVDDLPTAQDLLSWHNPPASLFALLGGEALLLCAYWSFGLGNTTFLSGVCNVLLLSLSINFVRSCFSERWLLSSRWSGSTFERVLMDRMQDAVSFAMVLRDESVCAINPWTMLKTATALLFGNIIGARVSFWVMAMIGWAGLFTVPITNKHLGGRIGEAYKRVYAAVQKPVKKLKMNRQGKLLFVGTGLLVAFVLASWTVRASMLLLFMMLVRCNLKTDEMKYFQNHKVTKAVADNQLLRSAFKATTRVGYFADDVLASAMKSAMKFVDRTPDHED